MITENLKRNRVRLKIGRMGSSLFLSPKIDRTKDREEKAEVEKNPASAIPALKMNGHYGSLDGGCGGGALNL